MIKNGQENKWGDYMNVLVTDSHYKHALAAIRSLGREKFNVICASSKRFNPSFLSKYCYKSFVYPDHENQKNEKIFIRTILKKIKEHNIDVVMPIGYKSNILFSQYKELFEKHTKMCIANQKTMEIAMNKQLTLKFAVKNNIPIPKTVFVENLKNIDKIKMDYPLIIKSIRESMGKKVEYVNSKKELIEKLKKRIKFGTQIIQEKIEGPGYGFFALVNHGKIVAFFEHKRLREYPYSGGVSSLAIGIYNKKLKILGEKLLKKLRWHGVAMVEFKYDLKDKKFKLMEINPKFWGSLDLAIVSGVNFPVLYCMLARYGKIKPVLKYKTGIKFQWLLPEDLITIKTAPNKSNAIKECFKNLFDSDVKKDINYLFEDPLPTLLRLGWTIVKLVK